MLCTEDDRDLSTRTPGAAAGLRKRDRWGGEGSGPGDRTTIMCHRLHTDIQTKKSHKHVMWLNDTIFISGGGRSSGGVAATAGTSARDGVPTFASMTPCWRQQPWVLFAVRDEHNRQIFYIGSRDMSSCVLGSKTVLIYCDVGTSSVAFMATKNRYFWQEMSSCVCANKTGCFFMRPQDTLQPCLWCQKLGCIQMWLWRHKWVFQATAGTFASLA